MKKNLFITICTIALLSINVSSGMSLQIDLLSSNHHIWGSAHHPSLDITFDITSSSPIDYSIVYVSGYDPYHDFVTANSAANIFYNDVSSASYGGSNNMYSESSYLFSPTISASETIDISFLNDPPHDNYWFGYAKGELTDLTDGTKIWSYTTEGTSQYPQIQESTFTYNFNSNNVYKLDFYCWIGTHDDSGNLSIRSSDFKVPEPSTMLLLGSGLVGLLGFCRRKK